MPIQVPRAGAKIMISKSRVIKMHSEYRKKKYDQNFRKVPVLKLSGDWLEDAGFNPSKIINVQVENDCLIINTIDETYKIR